MILLAVLIAITPAQGATKSAFSVFGNAPGFAEATCTGIQGFPHGTTIRLPSVGPDLFEAYANLPLNYKLVVSANRAEGNRTIYLSIAREDLTPLTASSMGLDAGIRQSSILDAYCEINAGPQITTR